MAVNLFEGDLPACFRRPSSCDGLHIQVKSTYQSAASVQTDGYTSVEETRLRIRNRSSVTFLFPCGPGTMRLEFSVSQSLARHFARRSSQKTPCWIPPQISFRVNEVPENDCQYMCCLTRAWAI